MKLSIVVTAYNVEKYITKTLNSIMNQTVKRFELIVVDDGSTDGSNPLIRDMLSGVQETEYKIIRKTNGGVSSARNRGMLEASGDYILFLDGDDYVADDLVKRIYDSYNGQNADVFCWGYDTVGENGELLESYFDA